jgi:hypothetical protein
MKGRGMSTEKLEREDDEARDRASRPNEQPMLYCPVCNEHLVQSRCNLICERCGYFMSCADYY